MSEGVAWNQGELSEDTREMIRQQSYKSHEMAVFNLIDEIFRPHHTPPKPTDNHLLRGLRNMLIDFQLSGQDDYAECVTLAIEALGGEVKPD